MGKKTFPPTLRKDDFPSIGQSRGGYTLVCHGDDCPDEWAIGLTAFVSSFEEITNLAEEHGVPLVDPRGGNALTSIIDFCEALRDALRCPLLPRAETGQSTGSGVRDTSDQ
jgi:hypothetical protein